MTRGLLRVALLTVAFGLGTYAFGWWAVPAVALAWGAIAAGAPRVAVRAAAAAALAWALLLIVPGVAGYPVFTFAASLAGAMQIPAWALWLAELGFPLLAAWSAALLGASLRGAPPARRAADAAPSSL